jgi:hypothetical protein
MDFGKYENLSNLFKYVHVVQNPINLPMKKEINKSSLERFMCFLNDEIALPA